MRMVGSAQHEVVLQTPYLVMSDRAKAIFERLHQGDSPPRIVVSTNSLASTDAFAVYALSYKHRKRYLKDYGFEIYEMKPHAAGPAEDNADAAADEGPPRLPKAARRRATGSARSAACSAVAAPRAATARPR